MGEKLGEYLRRKREEKNLTLEEIAKESRIQKRYLEALEKEEYGDLPGETYIKGFLRNYCSIIGVNGDEVVSRYDKEMQDEKQEAIVEEIVKRDWKEKKLVVNSLIALIVLIIFYLMVTVAGTVYERYSVKDKTLDIEKTEATVVATITTSAAGIAQDSTQNIEHKVESSTTASAVVSQPAIQTENNVEIKNVEIKDLTIKANGVSWLEVYEGNTKVYEGTIRKGEAKNIKSNEKITVKAGDAGFVQIELNGTDMGIMGKPKEVVRKEF